MASPLRRAFSHLTPRLSVWIQRDSVGKSTLAFLPSCVFMPALGWVQDTEASVYASTGLGPRHRGQQLPSCKDSSLLRINNLLLRTVNSHRDHEHAGQEGKLALTDCLRGDRRCDRAAWKPGGPVCGEHTRFCWQGPTFLSLSDAAGHCILGIYL